MEIKRIETGKMAEALELIWDVFLEFEAPDYTKEGVKEFKRTIEDIHWGEERDFYGAFEENEALLGVIATKDTTHIALFFVDGKHHKQGIGRKLFDKVEELNQSGFFTVNSSPYAHNFYKHLGFEDTNIEQCVNGLKFYPMRKDIAE